MDTKYGDAVKSKKSKPTETSSIISWNFCPKCDQLMQPRVIGGPQAGSTGGRGKKKKDKEEALAALLLIKPPTLANVCVNCKYQQELPPETAKPL